MNNTVNQKHFSVCTYRTISSKIFFLSINHTVMQKMNDHRTSRLSDIYVETLDIPLLCIQ